MDCEFAEKVSLLIDGELPLEETEGLKAHLAGCQECRGLERDFLFFRQQIKEPVAEPIRATPGGQPAGAGNRKVPFWKKRILLPTPVFALLLLLLAAFGVWTVALNLKRSQSPDLAGDSAKKLPTEKEFQQKKPSEISLSRYDKGGRTEIYTTVRQAAAENEKSRSVNQ